MNILYLCDEYPPGPHGGIGTSVRLLAREMVKQGHKVIVAGLYTPGYGEEDVFKDEGVKVFRFRMGFDTKWFDIQRSLLTKGIIRILKDTGLMERDVKRSLAGYQKKLEKIIADHHIDIIEMPDYNDYMRFCKSYVPFPVLSVPVIVKMNGSMTYFAKEAGKQVAPQIFKMEQVILNQAEGVVAVSKYTAVKSSAYFSYKGEIKVINNGIDTAVSTPVNSKKPYQVIFTGTLVQKKGIYQLAKAWNIVNERIPDARLLILGKGWHHKVMAYLTTNAKDSVTFKGHVTTEILYNYLAESSIAVLPSYAEAFSLAPLEAMTCGIAVINSNCSSGPELITDKVDGLLIDPDDVEQMASSILYLLTNPAACAGLAKKGNERVKAHFEISKIAGQNIEYYKQVLNGVN